MNERDKGSRDTEQRILKIIAKHAIEHPGKKIGKAALAAAVGITRQALHRYYSHLNPYITGEKHSSEVLADEAKEEIFSTGFKKLNLLESELASIKAEMEEKVGLIKSEYITSLMKSDLSLHDADGLRARLEAQSLHNGVLINKIKSLEAQLTAARLDSKEIIRPSSLGLGQLNIFDINLKNIFEQYQVHCDKVKLDGDKVRLVQEAISRAEKNGYLKGATLVLFIDRYICSFNKFCEDFRMQRNGIFVIVRCPIFSFLQLKSLILAKLDIDTAVKVFFPWCDTESVIKAQRAFYFSNVPSHEIALADKLPNLVIPDQRVNEMVLYRVKQGQ